ncbi:hypothetical protein [Gillisia sp. Hel_I_29]|uniref:hypothetical protein n=1 Tax=Gillisia sp. Hel_I_29 TaxID=1249975 RepID=UPI000551A15A|nr:hypothetical protein [Gillisia sp. Hel_I_29]
MKIINKDDYKILRDEKNEIAEFANYMSHNHSQFQNDNVIIDILKKGDLELEELLMFLEISNIHRAEKRSFVIVNDAVDIDQVPEELIVVPTILEATDIIKMEELERELGF